MNRIRIGILLLLFIVLGVYVYFYETEPAKKIEQAPKVEKAINFNPAEVREIVLKKQTQSVLLKKNGQWRVAEPVEADAGTQDVLDLLSFFNYGIVRVIETNPSNLKEYGLDRPKYEIGIKTKGDDTFKMLLIGDDGPGNLNSYAKVGGEPKIILLGVRYRQEFDRAFKKFYRGVDSQK